MRALQYERYGGPEVLSIGETAKPAIGDYVASLVAEGRLKPIIEKIYRFDEGVQAFRHLESGHAAGKIVITMN